MLHKVRMNEKTLKEFAQYLEEKDMDKSVSQYIDEETDSMKLKGLIIKALNCLNDIAESGMVDRLQMRSYVQPAFDKLMALRDDIGR